MTGISALKGRLDDPSIMSFRYMRRFGRLIRSSTSNVGWNSFAKPDASSGTFSHTGGIVLFGEAIIRH